MTYEKKWNAIFYVEINKDLYGLLQSALLLYKKLRKELEAYGCMINPYDSRVANYMIESQQMTVTRHVENRKISHKDIYQTTKFAIYLSRIYGKKLAVQRGKVHDYLGMELDYSE